MAPAGPHSSGDGDKTVGLHILGQWSYIVKLCP